MFLENFFAADFDGLVGIQPRLNLAGQSGSRGV